MEKKKRSKKSTSQTSRVAADKKYTVIGVIIGNRHLGYVYAKNHAEACIKAEEKFSRESCSVCHQCSREIEDPEIDRLIVDEVTNDGEDKED